MQQARHALPPWLAFIAFTLALPPAHGEALRTVDYARSRVTFAGKQMGVPAEGHFKRFGARVAFDPERLAEAKAEIEIDIASVSVGDPEADAEVKRKAWFDLAGFPKATFVAAGFNKAGDNRYEAPGKLSIKGNTREVTIPFTARALPNGATELNGRFTINRLDFAVGTGPWADVETVADEVEIRFVLVLGPPAPAKS